MAESRPLDELPPVPQGAADYARWRTWARACFDQKRAPILRVSPDGEQLAVALRALVAHGFGATVGPEDAPKVALQLFEDAHGAPPLVVRAAERLLRRCMEDGATSADTLYLAGAFAWPLRDVAPEISDTAWQYLVHAPWQTDSAILIALCHAAQKAGAFAPDRSLVDLADQRLEAGLEDSARELLEAIALIQAKKERLDQIGDHTVFARTPVIEGTGAALARLARIYVDSGEAQLHAREIMRVVAIAEAPTAAPLAEVVTTRVWDLPLPEIYDWAKSVQQPREVDEQIHRALDSRQPHLARRIAEATLIPRFDKVYVGSPQSNRDTALARFIKAEPKEIVDHAVTRRAAEHLAVLYARTHHATRQSRELIEKLLPINGFTGPGAPLHEARDELARFAVAIDPYIILQKDEQAIAGAARHLSDAERRAADDVSAWFAQRFQLKTGPIERLVDLLATPLRDAAAVLSSAPGIEEACVAAFHTIFRAGGVIAGDLDPLFREGQAMRARGDGGRALMERAAAETQVERVTAAGLAAALSFLPPGLSLFAGMADLGATLLVTFRAIARVGALFGKDVRTPEGRRLVVDAFALGCSSTDGEGLVAHLSPTPASIGSRDITVGSIAYGSVKLVDYLWTTPGQPARAILDQTTRHLGRICGIELSQRQLAKVVPVAGAVLSGVAAYTFISDVTHTAIHLAMREHLVERAADPEAIIAPPAASDA